MESKSDKLINWICIWCKLAPVKPEESDQNPIQTQVLLMSNWIWKQCIYVQFMHLA